MCRNINKGKFPYTFVQNLPVSEVHDPKLKLTIRTKLVNKIAKIL